MNETCADTSNVQSQFVLLRAMYILISSIFLCVLTRTCFTKAFEWVDLFCWFFF